ncbi:MAG: HYR domain-containing protein, partial [FCB group bacterium]|nr:HYR domain-containing protein [FCB group bacterium]
MPRLVIFVFLFLSVTLCLGADTSIRIGTANNIRYEHETQIAITLDNQSGFFEMGGFDLLLTYSSSLTLQNVVMGSMLSDCAWEYYTTQTVGTNSLRLVAIAETINGPIHPSCFGTGNNDTLAVLTFQVSQYQALGCEFLPIYWNWYDCGDNAVSSVTGDTLFISDTVYESNGADDFPVGDNPTFPTPSGAPDECLPSLRGIDFYGGGIYALYRDLNKPQVVCPENIEVNIDSNECGSWVTFSVEVEDNCPGAIHYCIPPSGSFFSAGTTPVVCIGRDYSGNADTGSFNILVNDTIAPVLTVPGDTTVGSYPGLCGTAIGFEASATDN